MLVTLIIILLSVSRNANVTENPAYNNFPNTQIEVSLETTELSVEEQLKASNSNIKKWLENEVKMHVSQYSFDSKKYDVEIELIISKEGKLIDFKIDNTDNIELRNFLADILANAPIFEPVRMNGYAARMCYKVPLSILVI
jgi:hypothetical protein